jgi:hypothetical protein
MNSRAFPGLGFLDAGAANDSMAITIDRKPGGMKTFFQKS